MTDQEILKKVLAKAVKNGYTALHIGEFGIGNMANMMIGEGYAIAGLLHSHQFAKAFFGEEETCTICGSTKFESGRSYNADSGDDYWSRCSKCGTEPMSIFEFGISDGTTYPAWAYQLQQMVLEENPIKYLERFI